MATTLIILVSLLAIFYSVDGSESICNVTGAWAGYFPATQPYDDNEEYYIPSSIFNSGTDTVHFEILRTYGSGWSEGHGAINLTSLAVIVYLDGDIGSPGVITLNGKMENTSCAVINFENGSRWNKQNPFIKYVHVVHMTHLDIGYDGINPTVGYINNVLNKYFQSHLPRGVYLSNAMRQTGHQDRGFIYTQHPWLLSMYLDCPQNFSLNNMTLQCPNKQEIEDMKQTIADGDLVWQASAFNFQFEAMDETVFQASLNMAKELDKQFNITRKQYVLSNRDVPGITRAVIPILAKNNITAISIGQNPTLGPPPAPFDDINADLPCPRIFRWKDVESDTEVIAMWHSYGYGGIKRSDCVTVPYSSHALCVSVTGDNSGPPTSMNELLNEYTQIESEFPGSFAFSSTFEAFIDEIYPQRHQLPVVTKEFGDVWLQGIQSDSLKLAAYRETSRAFAECIRSGKCSYNDVRIQKFNRYLMKLPEHTWGLPSEQDNGNWSNVQFEALRETYSGFVNCSNAWVEQRQFLDYAIDALGDHPLANEIMSRLQNLAVPSLPDLSDYTKMNALDKIIDCGALKVQFDGNYGSIISFVDKNKREWARKESPIGIFEYVSYDESDFKYMCEVYSTGCYSKDGSQSSDIRNKWQSKMRALYVMNNSNQCSVISQVTFDEVAIEQIGAPQSVLVNISVNATGGIFMEVLLLNKTRTRLPEAMYFGFRPIAMNEETEEIEYSVLKMADSHIYFDDVMLNGSQYQHGVWKGVENKIVNKQGKELSTMLIQSLDCGLVSPITDQEPYPGWFGTPTVFPCPLKQLSADYTNILGYSFNFWNNIWMTNYILWYPYADSWPLMNSVDQNMKFRFEIQIN